MRLDIYIRSTAPRHDEESGPRALRRRLVDIGVTHIGPVGTVKIHPLDNGAQMARIGLAGWHRVCTKRHLDEAIELEDFQNFLSQGVGLVGADAQPETGSMQALQIFANVTEETCLLGRVAMIVFNIALNRSIHGCIVKGQTLINEYVLQQATWTIADKGFDITDG